MNKREDSPAKGVGVLGAIRERPLLFIVLVVTFFAGALIGVRVSIEPPSIDVVVRTDIIDLNAEADGLASLIRPAPLDAEGLKNAILKQDLSEFAGLDDLTILEGEQDGEFVVRLPDGTPFDVDSPLMNRLQAFADDRNRRRVEQKVEAERWIERRRRAWQARIDEAKATVAKSRSDRAPSRSAKGLESVKLLRLMIDATTEGQRKLQTNDGAYDHLSLATDRARLSQILRELEANEQTQRTNAAALKESETGLAEHIKETVALMREGGVLDRPAASIQTPISIEATTPLHYLQASGLPILLPASGAASMIFALIGTWLVCRFRPPIEIARNDHLNDPHWPLPPHAQRELST